MKTWAIEGDLHGGVVAALQKSPWFKALDKDQLASVVEVATLLSYPPGERIVTLGEPSDSIFLLMRGEVAVEVGRKGGDDTAEVGRMRPPFTFGEIGLLLGKRRTATVVAVEEVYALKFDAATFQRIFDEVPGFRLSLARGLASRLQDLSEMVLPEHTATDGMPSEELLAMLPPSFMQRHRVLPVEVEGNVITVGFIEDPTPQALAGVHQQLPGMEVKPVRITSQLFNRVLGSYAGAGAAAPAPAGGGLEVPTSEVSGENVSPLLRGLLERVVAEGGSDLHLCAGRKPLWRIDGEIQPIEDAAPLGRSEVLDLLAPVLQQRHRDEFAERRDTDFAVALAGIGRFRVNLYWTHAGVSAAMRQIPWKILTLEQLGMPPVIKSFCMQPKGLVLVTGPTGSGKSTTLAAMIDYINRFRGCHIVTLEDPVEFVHQDAKALVNQREIGSQVESFARGLRAALREDPDVVLLGEIREADTAALALEIANTGHLVFATLHTNSAVSTVERLVDMFQAEQQNQARATLADVLRGVVAQTLCKGRTGGRVAAVEVLVGGVAATNLIREGKPAQLMNVMQTGGKEGNRLLNDDLARLVRDRKVLYDEALSKAVDKYDLARRLGKVRGQFERTEGDRH